MTRHKNLPHITSLSPQRPAPFSVSLPDSLPVSPMSRPRFLSESACHDIAQRLARFTRGGGETDLHIVSRWTGNVRWARNRITTSGEDRDNRIMVRRTIRGAQSWDTISINEVSDEALIAAARRAERMVHHDREAVESDVATRPGSPFRYQDEPVAVPTLFFDATYQLDAKQRAASARAAMQTAKQTGVLSAGYIEVSAASYAIITSWGYARYYQYTWAQYSTTVRDPGAQSSGWAGVDWPDWTKINTEKLSAIALEKCLKSRNPVAIEPGRYTTILEPQAVCDFLSPWAIQDERKIAESRMTDPFHKLSPSDDALGHARLGERVIDERLTLSADPMDPEAGFPPYDVRAQEVTDGAVYHPATWIDRGILTQLPYDHEYAVRFLGRNTGLPNSGALRISVAGETVPVDDMIATTKRGLLVTRFDQVPQPVGPALLTTGYTRDGLWLIENGKITKAVKNMYFVESILFALNNVEQVGVPQRTFHPMSGGRMIWGQNPQPMFVPALRVRDFSFTELSAAI